MSFCEWMGVCVYVCVWMSVFELYKEMKMVTGCSDNIKLLLNEKLETMKFFFFLLENEQNKFKFEPK